MQEPVTAKIQRVLSQQLQPLTGGRHSIRAEVHYVDGTRAVIRNVSDAALEREVVVINARKTKTFGSDANKMIAREVYKLSRYDVQSVVWVQSLDGVAINTLVWHLHPATRVKVDISATNHRTTEPKKVSDVQQTTEFVKQKKQQKRNTK